MPEPLKVIITDTSWIGQQHQRGLLRPVVDVLHHRTGQITAFIAANAGQVKNVLLWHGDAHGVAYCTAADNPDGGFPVYCAAPMRQTGLAFNPVAATFTASYNNAGGDAASTAGSPSPTAASRSA